MPRLNGHTYSVHGSCLPCCVLHRVGLTSTKLIAKIENKEGLCAYRELIEAADAIVMARGSMGNCLDAEKMFIAQKMLLRECNLAGR